MREKEVQQQMRRTRQIRIPRLLRAAAEEIVLRNDAIHAVLLYGSRARGDHQRGSDYDVAVASTLPREAAIEATKPLYDENMEKRCWTELAYTSPEKLERYANVAGTLESRIAREGILIAGDWTGPECRDVRELDVNNEKALEWVQSAMGGGYQATLWLRMASEEHWSGDNEAATCVQRMAELVTKGIVASFGIHETDIHDLDRTADELANAYADTGWRRTEREELAKRIQALGGKGRAALRARKWKRTFEPLDETIGRLGGVWTLLIEWLETLAQLYPETGTQVRDIAQRVEECLRGQDEDPKNRGISPDLMEHLRRTRVQARRLASKLREQ